jgi:hypothetical protein
MANDFEMVEPSAGSTALFVVIVLAIVLSLVAAVVLAGRQLDEAPRQTRRWWVGTLFGVTIWLVVTGVASASGVLRAQTLPPPLALFMLSSLIVAVSAAFSRLGSRLIEGLPIAALVGVQAFRLPLELVLHRWHAEGVIPVQMTYQGFNFDILTGISALLVCAWSTFRKTPPSRALVVTWNVFGILLLANVMTIAVLSSPLPIRAFTTGVPVLLAFYFPYGWIIPFCVGGALFGHLVVFRWAFRRQPAAKAMPQRSPQCDNKLRSSSLAR